jgi:acyl dehydratase
MNNPTLATVAVGDVLPSIDVTFTRADLVRYAGASGDFNIIHWNERTALAVGLPGVIAHGMLTMGHAIRVITQWTQDPTAVLDYQVRFTRPVVVPDNDEGVVVTFTGKISAINDNGTVKVDIGAVFEEKTVLARSSAIVRLPA